MTEGKYSKITLIPKDEEERRKFKAFRNEDVFSMFTFVSALASCEVFFLVAAVINSLFEGSDIAFNMINFVYQLVIALAMWLIWFLGKRFKDQYAVMIAGLYVIIQLCFSISVEFLSEFEDPGFVVITKIVGYLVLYMLLLAPSIYFVIWNTIVYSISIVFIVLLQL